MTGRTLTTGARSLLRWLERANRAGQMDMTAAEEEANSQDPGHGRELLNDLEEADLIKVIGLAVASHTQLVRITSAGRHALAAEQTEAPVKRGRIAGRFSRAWAGIRSIRLRRVPDHKQYWFKAAGGCGAVMLAMIPAATTLTGSSVPFDWAGPFMIIAYASGAAAITCFVLGVRQVRFPFVASQVEDQAEKPTRWAGGFGRVFVMERGCRRRSNGYSGKQRGHSGR